MSAMVDIAIVGLSASFEQGQGLAGWWRGLVCKGSSEERGLFSGGQLGELLLGAALSDAGVEPSGGGARLASFLDGVPVAEKLADAARALRAGACDLALVGILQPEAGGSVLVLKRLEDCQRGRERIYAVIKECRSWRSGETGEGAHPPPPGAVGLVVAGLVAEAPLEHVIEGLEQTFGQREGALPACGLSLCQEGAEGSTPFPGGRSLVAATLALHHRVFPPTAGDVSKLAGFLERSPFHASTDTSFWLQEGEGPRRAGVFLLGGSQRSWVMLEAPGELAHERYARPVVEEWPLELVLLSAPERGELLARVRQLRERLEAGTPPSLRELARELARAEHSEHRLAIIASSLTELRGKLRSVEEKLAEPGRTRLVSRNGLFYSDPSARVGGKLAFLFPGQGSQYANMLRELGLYLPEVRAWLDQFVETSPATEDCPSTLLVSTPSLGLGEAGKKIAERGLYSMEGGAQVSFVVSIAMCELLAEFGIHADVMVGYSNGENSSLAASGAWKLRDRAELFTLMRRIKLESLSADAAGRLPKGAALAVSLVPRASIERELEALPKQLFLAMDNCPGQVVLFGSEAVIEDVATRLRAEGALCFRLPFGRAYHTPLFEKKARHIREVWEQLEVGPPRLPVYSCATAAPYPEDPAGIRSLVAGQLAMRVRFRETVERLYADGVRLFVEIAPGGMLTGFVNDTLQGRKVVTTATALPNRSDLLQLQQTLALLFVDGRPVDLSPFFRLRSAGAPVAPQAPAPLHEEASPPPAGLRGELLQRHMGLMNAFFQKQNRIASLLGRQAVDPSAPEAGGREEEEARWPLLGPVVERGPGYLYCRRRISLDRDLYLADHSLGREQGPGGAGLGPLPVVPFTFCMEMMAEAATRLVGELPVVELREIRGLRWLALDQGSLEVGIHAELETGSAAPQHRVRVRLFELEARHPNGRMLLFEGVVRLAEHHEEPPVPREQALLPAGPPRWHPREVYERLFFHGPRLQSMRSFRALGPRGIEVEVEVPPCEQLLAGTEAPPLRIPASLLDCLGQLVGYWLLEQSHMYFGVFPFYMKSFRQYRAPPTSGTSLLARTRVTLSGGVTSQDCEFLDGHGQLVARVEGMQSRYFDFDRRFLASLYWGAGPESFLSEPLAGSTEGARVIAPLPPTLFESGQGIWLRALAHMVLGERERALWYALPAEGPGRIEWLLDRVAAKDALRIWARERLGVVLGPRQLELLPGEGGMSVRCSELPAAGALPAVTVQHVEGRTIALLRAAEPASAPLSFREVHFQEQHP
jgi:malonyl CoA-acyl carrier protein transacylase